MNENHDIYVISSISTEKKEEDRTNSSPNLSNLTNSTKSYPSPSTSSSDPYNLSNHSSNYKIQQSPGCAVTSHDTPLVIASIACFISFFIYGACSGSLGAALPSLAFHYDLSEAQFGFAFTTRGIGYLTGTLGFAALVELPQFQNMKPLFVCLSSGIMGMATGLIPFINSYRFVFFMYWIQGIGFGGVDTLANCVMPELWEERVGPWMQSLHSFFGIGAILGPAMVGSWKYGPAFVFMGLTSISPFVLISIYELIIFNRGDDKYSQKQQRQSHTFHNSDYNPHNNNNSNNKAQNHNDREEETEQENNRIEPNLSYENQTKVSYGTNTLKVESTQTITKSTPILVPWTIRILIATFFFVYVGVEAGYGGWITTFAISEEISSTEEQAAYLVSYYWFGLTIGRFLAIFLAIVLSNTRMLRIQLVLCSIGCVMLLLILKRSYFDAKIASSFFGFALSSIYPLAMTLVADYGFSMDTQTTTLFVVGSTCGEALIPIAIGVAMDRISSFMLPTMIISLTMIFIGLYVVTHMVASRIDKTRDRIPISYDNMEESTLLLPKDII